MLEDLTHPNLDSVRTGVVQELRAPDEIGTSELRMWLFVRKDLPMPMGKFGSQAGHGYGTCLLLAHQKSPEHVESYMKHGQGKITVGVKNEAELLSCVELCREAGLTAIAVKDAAHTVFTEPTYTVGAVGPCYREDLPKRVARLQLFIEYKPQPDGQ